MQGNPQLQDFLKAYPQDIQDLFWSLRQFIIDQCPTVNELIWDNYNALAIAYAKSDSLKDAFCHLSLYGKHINFGFNRGVEINALIPLSGNGKLIRHVSFKVGNAFPEREMIKMLSEASAIADERNPNLMAADLKNQSIVKSISEKKRRPK